ncbi:hypothetical protein N0V88_000848 [Collariella sp. IMI 366227]|nr:hypothetical protein N0V88_000848 [Collariella sp. IMI 366227]
MGRRNLLLCFDAFGTLFTPKQPIAEQYTLVARKCGLDGFSVDQVKSSFKTAFSKESKAHPNYGKASGMGAAMWWTHVINNTFRPLLLSNQKLPTDLPTRLLHCFSSSEGYTLSPGITSFLRNLKNQHHPRDSSQPHVIIGVITNSDDRVPAILTSLGLRVSPFRAGSPTTKLDKVGGKEYDIDVHCMSYDVGVAKPDRRIFDAAVDMADQLVVVENGGSRGDEGASSWLKLYVGDEYEKDVVGAREAGWHSVFVGKKEDIPDEEKALELGECQAAAVEEVFREGEPPRTIRAESTQSFIQWLSEKYKGGQY